MYIISLVAAQNMIVQEENITILCQTSYAALTA